MTTKVQWIEVETRPISTNPFENRPTFIGHNSETGIVIAELTPQANTTYKIQFAGMYIWAINADRAKEFVTRYYESDKKTEESTDIPSLDAPLRVQ